MRATAVRVIGAALLCVLAFVPAAGAQGGVNLAWNNCPAEGGLANLDFECGSNAGLNVAVASFVLPADAPKALGIYAVVDVLGTADPSCAGPGCVLAPLPAWWAMQPDGCRYGSISYSTGFNTEPFDAATRCFDAWQGKAFGGFEYATSYLGNPGHARFRIVAAMPYFDDAHPELGVPESLVAGREYYGFQMRMNNAKSTGAGSCDGCAMPVTLVLSLVEISQPAGVGDFSLSAPVDQGAITWQRARAGLTPVARRTWGQVKSLYR